MRGFVPTPNKVVDHMVDLLFEGRDVGPGERLLDPGCGTGAFMDGVVRWSVATRAQLPQLTGIELNRQLALEAASHFRSHSNVSVKEGDFLGAALPSEYDYVIGNPPYVSILRLDQEEKGRYRNAFRTATGRFDLYMLFFERALDVLRPGGRLVFVTPEKFTYVDSASSLRTIIGSHDIHRLEFLPEDTFGDLVTYPLIAVVEKGSGGAATRVVSRDGAEKVVQLPHGGGSWAPLLNGAASRAKQVGVADVLSAVCDRVSCGVATGADGVFVFERNELPNDLHQFAWPAVAGKDLDLTKDLVEVQSVMLVPYDADGSLIPLEDLGPFGRYLMEPLVSARLRRRTCVSRKPWYAFHETPYMSQILRPKILCKDIARRPAFWLDRSGSTLPRHSTYYIVPRDESILEPLCEYLNGRQAHDWLMENCQRAANGFIRMQSNVLKRLPIPIDLIDDAWPQPRPALEERHPDPGPHILEMVA